MQEQTSRDWCEEVATVVPVNFCGGSTTRSMIISSLVGICRSQFTTASARAIGFMTMALWATKIDLEKL